MDENRLQDGACICDVLVQASPEKVAAAFGRPVKLAQGGTPLAEESMAASIALYAAAWEGLNWCVVEAVDSSDEPEDYIVTLLRQAGAALTGNVLPLPLSYENGLGVAHRVAKELGTSAVVVWGSDEWTGLGGGALFDASGTIVRACNVSGPAALEQHLASRERMIAGDYDDDEEPSDDDDGVAFYEPGTGLRAGYGDIIEILDGWFRELGAAQPQTPPSLWGAWENYSEVWGAVSSS